MKTFIKEVSIDLTMYEVTKLKEELYRLAKSNRPKCEYLNDLFKDYPTLFRLDVALTIQQGEL